MSKPVASRTIALLLEAMAWPETLQHQIERDLAAPPHKLPQTKPLSALPL